MVTLSDMRNGFVVNLSHHGNVRLVRLSSAGLPSLGAQEVHCAELNLPALHTSDSNQLLNYCSSTTP